jgi:hypothetical protein
MLGVTMTISYRTATIYFVAVVVANVVACAAQDLPTATQVQKDVEAALNVGDSSEKIEAFFKSPVICNVGALIDWRRNGIPICAQVPR